MKFSIKEDTRKMDQGNFFHRSYWKQGKWSLSKKHLYKGFSKNSCSIDLNDIKNALLKHQQIGSKIPTINSVAGLHLPGTYFTGSFIFQNLFLYIGNTSKQNVLSVCIHFLPPPPEQECLNKETNSLFLQKIRCNVLVSYNLGTLQLIF